MRYLTNAAIYELGGSQNLKDPQADFHRLDGEEDDLPVDLGKVHEDPHV